MRAIPPGAQLIAVCAEVSASGTTRRAPPSWIATPKMEAVIEPGVSVEVALVDTLDLDFDATGIVRNLSDLQGLVSVELLEPEPVRGRVELLSLRQVREA